MRKIKRWDNGKILHEGEFSAMKLLVEDAVENGISLNYADLSGKNLRCANLSNAKLSCAKFNDAELYNTEFNDAVLKNVEFNHRKLMMQIEKLHDRRVASRNNQARQKLKRRDLE